jgi:hypothetical protein
MKPTKGKYNKNNAPPKKRFLIGLKVVTKQLNLKKIKMVIIAINLEKVEGQNGLD